MNIKKMVRKFLISPLQLSLLPLVWGQMGLDLNLPDKAQNYLQPIQANYALNNRINPFYLRGDFDGDSITDYAFLVASKKTKENGIALYLSSSKKTYVIGAATPFNGMTNLDFDGWFVYGKQKVIRGVGEGAPPVLKSEAIFIKWEESASAIIYWNGHKFIWYQQGD